MQYNFSLVGNAGSECKVRNVWFGMQDAIFQNSIIFPENHSIVTYDLTSTRQSDVKQLVCDCATFKIINC